MAVVSHHPSSQSHPRVFLCHASADKDLFVRGLAETLRAAGVQVWYDEWSMRPGDSLRRKIFAGIADCTHFVVVLSRRSIGSPWVQEELDAATVRLIEGTARIVPVVFGRIKKWEIPLDLRGKVYERFPVSTGSRFDSGVRGLLGAMGVPGTTWSIGNGVTLRVPRTIEIYTEWRARNFEVMDWRETRVSYDFYAGEFTLDNGSNEPILLGSPLEWVRAQVQSRHLWYSELGVVLSSGQPQLEDYDTQLVPGYPSTRITDQSRYRVSLLPVEPSVSIPSGATVRLVFKMGEATVHLDHDGEALGLSADGLIRREWMSRYLDDVRDTVSSGLKTTLLDLPIAGGISVSSDRVFIPDSYSVVWHLLPGDVRSDVSELYTTMRPARTESDG